MGSFRGSKPRQTPTSGQLSSSPFNLTFPSKSCLVWPFGVAWTPLLVVVPQSLSSRACVSLDISSTCMNWQHAATYRHLDIPSHSLLVLPPSLDFCFDLWSRLSLRHHLHSNTSLTLQTITIHTIVSSSNRCWQSLDHYPRRKPGLQTIKGQNSVKHNSHRGKDIEGQHRLIPREYVLTGENTRGSSTRLELWVLVVGIFTPCGLVVVLTTCF